MDIIRKIFESATEDERTRPVLDLLQEASTSGRWNPEALNATVESATLRALKESE